MVVRTIPADMFDTKCGVTGIEDLELPVFVAAVEDQFHLVLPLEPVLTDKTGTRVPAPVVFACILHHHRLDLFLRTGHQHIVIVQIETHLLVTLVGVDVGIRGDSHRQSHRLFRYHKLHRGDILILSIFCDVQSVVAAQSQTASVGGNLQLVVGIGYGGVDTPLIMLNHIAVEAFEPVTLEELLRGGPVCFAMFQTIHIAMIVMRQFVEADIQHIIPLELHHGR